MRDLNNMRSLDLETCLNDCRQRQYPFTFWNETEVGLFNLADLPNLNREPRDWSLEDAHGPRIVDLNKPKEVKAAKNWVLRYVIELEDQSREVAFAITKADKSRVHIQVYFQ